MATSVGRMVIARQVRGMNSRSTIIARTFTTATTTTTTTTGARTYSNKFALSVGAAVVAGAATISSLALCEGPTTPTPTPTSIPTAPFVLPEGLKQLASMDEYDVVLYQYEPCPFCNKVRAFLDYHKIPYRTVEVNPLFKGELKFSAYKKVPVAVIQGVQVNSSANIIQVLAALLPASHQTPKPTTTITATTSSCSWWQIWPFYSSPTTTNTNTSTSTTRTPALVESDQTQWCTWVDDVLVHLLPANIYRTPTEALHSFDYLLEHGNFPAFQRDMARYVGAAVMHLLSKYRLNKKYGITQPREQLYATVDTWVTALGDQPFHGGATPDRADLSVFGVLRSIESYDVFDDLIANSHVQPWYQRMTQAVGQTSRVVEQQQQ